MQEITLELLLLLFLLWVIGVALNRLNISAFYTQFAVATVAGPALLGLFNSSQIINTLAQLAIFFLLLYVGLLTPSGEFIKSIKRSLAVAIFGAFATFTAVYLVSIWAGISLYGAVVFALAFSVTAVAPTMKILGDSKLTRTDAGKGVSGILFFNAALFTLIFIALLAVIDSESALLEAIPIAILKTLLLLIAAVALGRYIFPRLTLLLRIKSASVTLLLIVAIGLTLGALAHIMGLEPLLGALFAGLFIKEEFLTGTLFSRVQSRTYAIAYLILAPFFATELALNIEFAPIVSLLPQILIVTVAVVLVQVTALAIGAYFSHFSKAESLFIGLWLFSRAELSLIIATIAIWQEIILKGEFLVVVIASAAIHSTGYLTRRVGAKALRREEPYKTILKEKSN